MTKTRLLAAVATAVLAVVVLAGAVMLVSPQTTDSLVGSGPRSSPGAAPSTSVSTTPPAAPPMTTAAPTTVPRTTVPPTTSTTTPPTAGPAPSARGPRVLAREARGAAVRSVQTRLRELGYWLGPVDGVYGELTRQAVVEFQKVQGLPADGVAGPATQAALASAGRPAARSSGDRVEVDKERQVLLVVRDGAVLWAFNTSTGTDEPYQLNGRTEMADTPDGHWPVSRVVDGFDVGQLGPLYRPRYFHPDGIAVHGYPSVPPYPASHGCVRVSKPAMDFIWAANLMPVGSDVWVY